MKSIAYRKYQLLQLGYMLKDNLDRWYEAAASDLGRPPIETDMCAMLLPLNTRVTDRFVADRTDINPTLGDVVDAYNHVEKWAKPEKPAFDLRWTAMRPITYKEPKGVCLIISPFNYPIWLTLGPAVRSPSSFLLLVDIPSRSVVL
jgi:aldehyde dehydrogenase (NAD+)